MWSTSRALLLFGAVASATDFYVAPGGSDLNNGTAGHPFKTLTKAQYAVRSASGTSDNVVHVADGTYVLEAPLNLTADDSGRNGHTNIWEAAGQNATISGGLQVTGWTLGPNGVYSASVPSGTLSRNLFVGGQAANYARRKLANRKDFNYTSTGMSWSNATYDWIMTTPGIADAEIRFINSFTDRYCPIQSVGNRELVMTQNTWSNQIIGYDTVSDPFADFGVWVQNALGLLTEGGEFYLDSVAGKVYYMPLAGEDMSTISTWLGVLEALVAVTGTYEEPVHDISFRGLNFAHTTWLAPGTSGYADQQTGGYIGANVTYAAFEASRPHWWQMPSAIQINAAQNISFSGGTYTQLGSGGFGIGNDPTAYTAGPGLGTKNISVTQGYFTQVMGNSITAGGVQADAHHPSDPRMTNSHITISENIFYNISSLFSSTVSILATYVQDSTITSNDINVAPYSGICHGYGWGSNDAGGSPQYLSRGLYDYQPLYLTPTTLKNNVVAGNLAHGYGYSHTDLGAYYTLSAAPNTSISHNYAYDSKWFGIYTDEGSNAIYLTDNMLMSSGAWFNPNQNPTSDVGNQTLIRNFGASGSDLVNAPNRTGPYDNTFFSNYNAAGVGATSAAGQKVAYRAGIPPGRRGNRPVSNDPALPDAYLSVGYPTLLNGGVVLVNLSNFDDVAFAGVKFAASVLAGGWTIAPISTPTSVPADSFALASFRLSGAGCLPPTLAISAVYTNPRTGKTGQLNQTGTLPGSTLTGSALATSSAANFPSQFGQSCDLLGITTSGRDVWRPYDDWASLYTPAAIGATGSVAAKVLSLDPTDPWSKAGVVVRNSLALANVPDAESSAAGYAAVFVTPGNGVSFQWDSNGDGRLETLATVGGVTAPVCLQLSVNGTSFSGYYAPGCGPWKQLGSAVSLSSRKSSSDAGLLVSAHSGFRNATALFSFNLTATA